MARLIDADTMIDEMVKIPGNRWNTKTLGEALDRIPTIDAVPVDWMTKRMNETASGAGMNIELNNALFTVGVEWEKWRMENETERR